MGKKKKKTIKVLVPRSDNSRAQRLYLISIGLMIWIGAIRTLLVIQQLVLRNRLNLFAGMIEVTIFLGFVVGLYGILKVKPPLHYFNYFSATLSLITSSIISLGRGSIDIFVPISILILYLGLRFPIRFEWEKRRLSD